MADQVSISEWVWREKYRRGDEQTLDDTWRRIAVAVAEPEKHRQEWAEKFFNLMSSGLFIPAGRIIAGAGLSSDVTLFNCLSGDTSILTLERGVVPISSVSGEIVSLLDGNGHWTKAPVFEAGVQDTYAIEMREGAHGRKRTVRATAEHAWIVAGCRCLTKDLSVGDEIEFSRPIRPPSDCQSYRDGLEHGLVYGDGSHTAYPHRYQIRLCGNKRDFLCHLRINTVSYPPSANGDPVASVLSKKHDLKSLPRGTEGQSYILGFIRGWIATDGSVSTQPEVTLCCGPEEEAWLRKWAPVIGMQISGSSILAKRTNFGDRNKESRNVRFVIDSIVPEDILSEVKRARLTAPTARNWRVLSVSAKPVTREAVYCARVVTTASFALGDGIHSGNCYVMGTIPDSMKGIMRSLEEASMTLRAGGGVGMDFSTLRPRGSPVVALGEGATSSGPVSFMALWDTMCGTIMSAGARRGAMMGVLRCDHPDIEEFITAKSTAGRLTNFNVSVGVTDEFMRAVEADASFDLTFAGRVYKTVNASDLWNQIIRSTYDTAEPGVLFIDRANALNPLESVETFATTNPCGEQWLPPYGACLLGSINVAKAVLEPFRPGASISHRIMDIATAVRFLDNVIEISKFPLPQQAVEAKLKRRIGLGITGLADALIMMGIRYGTETAADVASRLMRSVMHAADTASTRLGEEKGVYELAAGNPSLPQRRNSHLISIQPTGTTSLLAGNVSSGIEPVFDWAYTRRVRQPDGSFTEIRCEDYARSMAPTLAPEMRGSEWVTTNDLTPHEHLVMLEAVAPYVDSGISKTINCPADITFDAFRDVYTNAFKMGLKGCTTYRPTPVRGSVLVRDDEPKKEAPTVTGNVVRLGEPLARDEVLKGRTYKLKPSGSEHAIYVTINDHLHHGRRRPFEVFINTKAAESYPWIVALTRMISAVWRKGGDVAFVADELQQVFDPRGGYFSNGAYVPSICAGIGGVIARHLKETGVVDDGEDEPVAVAAKHCPKCQVGALQNREGCWICNSCDYSKCG